MRGVVVVSLEDKGGDVKKEEGEGEEEEEEEESLFCLSCLQNVKVPKQQNELTSSA